MSYLKINENQFLQKQELNRLVKFLDEDGFRLWMKQNSISFGLFNITTDGNFNNGRVTPDAGNTFQIAELFGIDSDLNFMYKEAQAGLQLNGGVVDDLWYWIKISHQFLPLEKGTVSIDASGNLTGTSTKFTEVLRGLPNFAAKIKFYNQDGSAATNNQEYEVAEVLSDTSATLAGVLSAESDLKYSVVGTFTAGSSPAVGNKEIFQYDDCLIEIVAEVTPNTPPAATAGQEFFLARIQNSAQLVIQDKRLSIYQAKDNYFFRNLDRTQSPLIGVEQVRYDVSIGTRSHNIVQVSWGFRTTNYTIDTNLNRVTYNTGVGGKFKSTADFTNGDFDGWRLYTADGKYSIIKSSIKSGSQINLDLDVLDVDRFSDDGGATTKAQTLFVVPDTNSVELLISGTIPNSIFKKEYPVSLGFVDVRLPVYIDPSCSYVVSYRYRNNNDYGPISLIPDDSVLGYLTEISFDDDGNIDIGNEVYQTYSSGSISLSLAPNAYKNVIGGIVTGDLFGYASRNLDNGNPLITLETGVNFQNQLINPTTITLTTEHYINLKTANAKKGNTFYIDIQADITLDGQTIQIVQDYINAGDPGTLLLDLSFQKYLLHAKIKNLIIQCIFDGTNWRVIPTKGAGIYDSTTIVGGIGTLGGAIQANWTLATNNDYRIIDKWIYISLAFTKLAGAANPAYILPQELWPADIVRFVTKASSTNEACLIVINAIGEISLFDISTGGLPSDGSLWVVAERYIGADLI